MKKFLPLLVIALIGAIGIFFFFYYFGHNDDKALTEFSMAYQNYDRAFSDLSALSFTNNFKSTPQYDDLEQIADQALDELTLKASARISSLTRRDAEIMSLFDEIADLSGKELVALKAYHHAMAEKDPALAQLSTELQDINARRQAAYTCFQELSGN
jgi:glutaredoxin 2